MIRNGGAERRRYQGFSGLRGLERQPVVERQLKVYPDELVLTNILIMEKAWEMLQLQNPGIYKKATFNHRGFVQPGLTVRAEAKREQVQLTVIFEIIHRMEIRYENQIFWNMWTNEEVCDHFFAFDKRLLPIERYEVQDQRPWHRRQQSSSDSRIQMFPTHSEMIEE
jgi:hypothetical protein